MKDYKVKQKKYTILDQVFWYTKNNTINTCHKDMHADVVIIGGGIAGLSAAQAWHEQGKKVILLEQWHCGAGATGKSSGFVTPNAELSLTDFTHRYNTDGAIKIWKFISQGVENIRTNILTHNFQCDYQQQDTMIVANNKQGMKSLIIEHENLLNFGYQTQLYDEYRIQEKVNSQNYVGGVAYQNTFGMNAYQYCQELKIYLQSVGVLIFEETPVLEIQDHKAITKHATITGDYLVICTDRFIPELNLLKKDVYQAQTFLLASEILSDKQIKTLFPDKNLMVWDTDFIYQYFRVTGDNRLLLGGGDFATTYASKTNHEYQAIIKKLTKYLHYKFPTLAINFEYQWSGLMGISKDIGPIAGKDKEKPYFYYVTAATGLPIAAALGRYSAENLLNQTDHLDTYFSPYRKFPISGIAQSILGNKITFALCNLIKKNIP